VGSKWLLTQLSVRGEALLTQLSVQGEALLTQLSVQGEALLTQLSVRGEMRWNKSDYATHNALPRIKKRRRSQKRIGRRS